MDLEFSVTVSRPRRVTQLTQINADAMPNYLPLSRESNKQKSWNPRQQNGSNPHVH